MASEHWAVAHAAIEEAQARDRLWFKQAGVRLAKLRLAAELEAQGNIAEAAQVLAEVRAAQAEAGIG